LQLVLEDEGHAVELAESAEAGLQAAPTISGASEMSGV
jgi:hypothetical protein